MNCEIRDGILHLDGEITVKTVHGNAYRQFVQLSGGDIKAVDLSAVSRADSACLSLLFSVLRRNGSRPELRPAVADLSELYEVREWITP